MSGRAVAQAVIDATKEHRESVYAMSAPCGDDYPARKNAEEKMWRALNVSKQALRDHMYQTYGVDLITLQGLIQG